MKTTTVTDMDPSFWQTNKMRLRAAELDDARPLVAWLSDPEFARNTNFFEDNLYPPPSLYRTQEWLDEQLKKDGVDASRIWIIEQRDGDVPVGFIRSHNCEPRHGVVQISSAIAREHRRKGFGSDALSIMLKFYFGELRYQKAALGVYSFNAGGIAHLTQFGFSKEGELRRVYYHNSQFFNLIFFGITAEEFFRKERDRG